WAQTSKNDLLAVWRRQSDLDLARGDHIKGCARIATQVDDLIPGVYARAHHRRDARQLLIGQVAKQADLREELSVVTRVRAQGASARASIQVSPCGRRVHSVTPLSRRLRQSDPECYP